MKKGEGSLRVDPDICRLLVRDTQLEGEPLHNQLENNCQRLSESVQTIHILFPPSLLSLIHISEPTRPRLI
eukprot:1119190-Rhodomonas_salina.1